MISVLFVCLGNICRSPAAEGYLKYLVEKDLNHPEIRIESCGLGSWHIGQLPDSRMRENAKKRGIVLTSRAQQFHEKHLDEFDIILAADNEVLFDLHRQIPNPEYKSKIHLMTAFSKSYHNQEIPDPYYGEMRSFELVLDMVEDSCEGLLEHLKKL